MLIGYDILDDGFSLFRCVGNASTYNIRCFAARLYSECSLFAVLSKFSEYEKIGAGDPHELS